MDTGHRVSRAALDALRDEVKAQRAEAQLAVVAARGELARIETSLEQRTAALLAAQVEVRELEKRLRPKAVRSARRWGRK